MHLLMHQRKHRMTHPPSHVQLILVVVQQGDLQIAHM